MDNNPDDLVTVAVYENDVEANLVKNRVAAAGIKACFADEEAVAMTWQFAGAVGGIKLQVAQRDVEDARTLLERTPLQDDFIDSSAFATPETLAKLDEEKEEDEVFTERE